MTVFRKNFLREDEIGVSPQGGYRKADNYSRKALQWLVWMERELGLPINHAGRAREHRTIGGTLVGGYYETTTATITQRHVLQFHGCMTCFPLHRDRALPSATEHGDTLDSRYERTLIISWRLRQQGYLLVEK